MHPRFVTLAHVLQQVLRRSTGSAQRVRVRRMNDSSFQAPNAIRPPPRLGAAPPTRPSPSDLRASSCQPGLPPSDLYTPSGQSRLPTADLYVPSCQTGPPRTDLYTPSCHARMPRTDLYAPFCFTGTPLTERILPSGQAGLPQTAMKTSDLRKSPCFRTFDVSENAQKTPLSTPTDLLITVRPSTINSPTLN